MVTQEEMLEAFVKYWKEESIGLMDTKLYTYWTMYWEYWHDEFKEKRLD